MPGASWRAFHGGTGAPPNAKPIEVGPATPSVCRTEGLRGTGRNRIPERGGLKWTKRSTGLGHRGRGAAAARG